ncbi:MAG: response regulator [Planctomycetota bacterium]|jgi:two-component system chemotaxis response regulator CheY
MNDPLVIICVDDQREVLAALVKDLERLPGAEAYDIIPCESAADAREAIDEVLTAGERVALVISDHVMPVTTGLEFLAELTDDERLSDTAKVLLTGYAAHEDVIQAQTRFLDGYLTKPWDSTHLLSAIDRILAA